MQQLLYKYIVRFYKTIGLIILISAGIYNNSYGQTSREWNDIPIIGERKVVIGNTYTYEIQVGYDDLSISWSIGGGEKLSQSTLGSIITVRWTEPNGSIVVDYSFVQNNEYIHGYSHINICAKANAGPDRILCKSSAYQNLNTFAPSPSGGSWSGSYASPDGTISPGIPVGNHVFTYTTNPCEGFTPTSDQITVTIREVFNAPTVNQSIIYSCPGETHYVGASSPQTTTFNWYTLPSGSGLPVYTGTQLEYTSPDNEPHYFYVSAMNQDCGSLRTQVSFLPHPPLSISGGGSSCAPATGTVNMTLATGDKVERWERSYNNGISWDAITNAPKNASYSYTETKNTKFRAIVKRGSCFVTSLEASVNVIKSIGGKPVALYTVNQCGNIQGTITLGTSKTGEIKAWYVSNDKMTWKKVSDGGDAPIPFHVKDTTKYYFASVQLGTCASTFSDTIVIHSGPYAGPIRTQSQINCNTASGIVELTDKYGEVKRWEYKEGPDTDWKFIANSASPVYSFSLIKSTSFRVLVKLSNCPDSAYSPVATIEISNAPRGVLSMNKDVESCDSLNKPIKLRGQLKLKDQIGSIKRWEVDSTGTWKPIAGSALKDFYDYKVSVTTRFRVQLTVNGCDDIYSGEATVYVNPAYIGQARAADQIVKNYDGHSYITNGSIILSKGFKFHANSCQQFSITIDENYTLASSNENFIVMETIHKEGVKTLDEVNWLSVTDKTSIIEYKDGLGRPMQKVMRKASPLQKDVVQPIVYDNTGRQEYSFLPYVAASNDGTFKEDYSVKQREFYTKDNDQIANSQHPFSRTVFDGSALNIVIEQGAPGTAWQPLPVEGGGNTLKMGYYPNTETNIKKWVVPDTLPTSYDNYEKNQLLVKYTIDEKGFQIKEYTDKRGLTVLKRIEARKNQETIWLDTYYIYNELMQQCFILPPEAISKLQGNPTSTFLKLWAYSYQYDNRQRQIRKRLPGADWVDIYYDEGDRVRLTQDAVQRKKKEFLVMKYDNLARPIMTAIWKDSLNLGRNLIEQKIREQGQWYEESSNTNHGYTLDKSFPAKILYQNVLTVTYYDDYGFLNKTGFDSTGYKYVSENGSPASHSQQAMGLNTGSKVKILKAGSSKWLKAISYYDQKYRLIQAIKENHIGGRDRITMSYDFSGKVITSLHTHIRSGSSPITIKDEYTYDHAGRLLAKKHKAGSQATVNMVQNTFNELGALIEKNLHGTSTGFLQSVDYRYHIRGWITSINNAALNSDGGTTNNDANDVFGMEAKYENGLILNGSVPQFNGNISEVIWKNSRDNKRNGYSFNYDELNRLKAARYKTFVNNSWNNPESGRYDEEITSYDLNGNILALNRTGVNGYIAATSTNLYGAMDTLEYQYQGNKLLYVKDKVADIVMPTGFKAKDFSDGLTDAVIFNINNPATHDYAYDENGNLYRDRNKGIDSISYNILNLTERVQMAEGKYGIYTYDATGAKLSYKIYSQNGQRLDSTDYVGGLEYKGNVLQFILIEEGRLLPNGSSYNYEYFIKDYLGNVRAIVSSTASPTITCYDYYPFGMEHGRQNITTSPENKYKYAGKEEQKDWGVLDFGARMLDPVIGRWIVVDPLTEKMKGASPYNYAYNNPLIMIDLKGLAPVYNWEEHDKGNKGVYTDNETQVSWGEAQKSLKLGEWSGRSNNVLVISNHVKGDQGMTNMLVAAIKYSSISIIRAHDTEDAADKLEKFVAGGRTIGNLIFGSHGGQGGASFRIGSKGIYSMYEPGAIEKLKNDKNLDRIAKLLNKNSQVIIQACHTGSKYNGGVELVTALALKLNTTVYANQSWGRTGTQMFNGSYAQEYTNYNNDPNERGDDLAIEQLGGWTKVSIVDGKPTISTVFHLTYLPDGGITYYHPQLNQ